MSEKFVPRNSVGGEINKKTDTTKLGNEFLNNSKNLPKTKTKPNSSSAPINNADVMMKSAFEIQQIALDDITPRTINKYRQSRIEELAKSIENTGGRLIHPIVLVRGKDLPSGHEVREELKSRGESVDDLKYIIVSGERRFKAYQLLRSRNPGKVGKGGPYDTITANILTRTEAQNEKSFYLDANNQARHLSPAEAVWFIKDALSEIKTDGDKRNALIKMNSGSAEGIPEEASKAARMFRVDKYCKMLLENEMGVSDWSDGTLRNMATVANNCSKEVADALLSGDFILREAKAIAPYPWDVQNELLKLFKEDRELYTARLQELQGKEKAKTSKVTHSDARRQLKATVKRLKQERTLLEQYAASLGAKNNRNETEAIKKYDAFIEALQEIIENTK